MKSNPNPNANKRTLSVPAPIPIPIPGSSSSSSTAFSAHRHRLNTAYDYSSLRLRSEGSRSSRIPSSNLNFRVSKAVVRDLRGNWIAKDVGGGFGRVPMTLRKRKKSTPTEHGQGSYVGEDENEASLVKVDGKSESTPRSNERAAKRRRVLEDDLDFLSAPDPQPQPQSSPPTVSEPAPDSANAVVTGTGTQPDVSQARDNLLLLPHERALSLPLPSSDLLKFIHHFASSFYHERGELFNATKAVRREKRIRMKAKLEQKRMEEEEEEEEEMSRVQPMPTRSSSRRGANRARTKEQQGNVSGEDMEPSDDLVDVDAEHFREEENLERRGSQSSPPSARQKSNNSPSSKAKGKGKTNATINTKHHPNRSAPQSPSRPVRRPASPSPSASSFHLSEDEGTEVDTDRDGEELNQDQNNDAQSDAKEKRKRKNRGMGYRGARRKNHQTDMYRVFDGSALMAIVICHMKRGEVEDGLQLLQGHIPKTLRFRYLSPGLLVASPHF
ncbi:hypothetical protein AX16_005011 [Volvariella volvacea WC 439]|nr:hypothetical protein AX16_005011 [Volvariella volvacea WC 439]